jgi:hypothetical protein
MPLLRLAYSTLFLLALLAVFELWSQVGGQTHLDLMPWYLKLILGMGAAFSMVKAAAAAVAGEKAWNRRTVRWAVILAGLLVCCGLASYYVHLYGEQDEDEEETQQSLDRISLPVKPLRQNRGAVCAAPRADRNGAETLRAFLGGGRRRRLHFGEPLLNLVHGKNDQKVYGRSDQQKGNDRVQEIAVQELAVIQREVERRKIRFATDGRN